jgi:hypothetical protein
MTDDATRRTWGVPFQTKDQIPGLLIRLQKKIERTRDIIIRRYKTDNEFLTSALSTFCEVQGVEHITSAPYAHHQMGTAERANRTIREKTATIIQDQSISGRITKIVVERSKELLRTDGSSTIPENL